MSFLKKFTEIINRQTVAGGDAQWPFIRGPFLVADATASIAVTTLGSEKLAEDLVALAPPGLCMASPLTGGRGDIEKLAHTLVSNLSIQHLICAGQEPAKPAVLNALQALFVAPPDELDDAMTAAGKSRLRLAATQVTALRNQVLFTDMHGCSEIDTIITRIRELASDTKQRGVGFVALGSDQDESETRVITAGTVTHKLQPDKAGQFKIGVTKNCITVEHSNSKNEILRIVEGDNARSIYLTLIRNGWVSKLDHAAYLGRELNRAEVALRQSESFVQDVDANDGEHSQA